jgi:hypothetical protein
MDYVEDGNLILFTEVTHWMHLDAAEEANHYLVGFVLSTLSQIAIRIPGVEPDSHHMWNSLSTNKVYY